MSWAIYTVERISIDEDQTTSQDVANLVGNLTAKVVVAALPAFVLSATNRQYQAPIPLLSFSVFLCIPLYLCNNFFFILLVEFTSIVLQKILVLLPFTAYHLTSVGCNQFDSDCLSCIFLKISHILYSPQWTPQLQKLYNNLDKTLYMAGFLSFSYSSFASLSFQNPNGKSSSIEAWSSSIKGSCWQYSSLWGIFVNTT